MAALELNSVDWLTDCATVVSVSQERVNRILAAGYGCFAHHGLRKTTMDDIATAAGMSRPAVYQYVRNKQDVFRRLASVILDTALAQADAAAGENRSRDRLRNGVALLVAGLAAATKPARSQR